MVNKDEYILYCIVLYVLLLLLSRYNVDIQTINCTRQHNDKL